MCADAYVMSVTLPDDAEQEAILVSPPATMMSISCLSFYIYFNISSADVIISMMAGSNTTLGLLQYPFSTDLFKLGENLCLFKIRLMIPAGSYRVMFIAKGKAGSISIWNIEQRMETCTNSSMCNAVG